MTAKSRAGFAGRTVCLAFALVLGQGTFSGADLQVTVVPAKQTFLLGEPVYVNVTLKNSGAEAVSVSADPLMFGLVIRILPPGSSEPVRWSAGANADGYRELRQLNVGGEFRDRGLISHYFGKCNFPVPGAYQVWGEYVEAGIRAVSEQVEVVVTQPSEVDAKAKDLFFSEAGQFFVHPGGYTLPSQWGMTPAIADFERIVSEFPTSAYAPYAAYYLARRKSKPGRYNLAPEQPSDPIPPDYARAIELAHFAESNAAFPLKGEARLLQAECYFEQGDRKKANALLQSVGSLPGLSQRGRAEALVAKLMEPAQ